MTFEKRCFRLPRARIAYLRFILESYDGLAFASTLDPQEALVEIAFPACRRGDVEALLAALATEFPLVEAERPPMAPES